MATFTINEEMTVYRRAPVTREQAIDLLRGGDVEVDDGASDEAIRCELAGRKDLVLNELESALVEYDSSSSITHITANRV